MLCKQTSKPIMATKPRKPRGPPKPPAKSRARTPPSKVYPTWSEAKYWAFIRSTLRAGASRWPPKYEVLKEARRPYDGPDKRTKWEFQCAKCKGWFKSTQVSVDHIVPAGSINKFEDVAGFVERLFTGTDGLQVLCDTDHKAKTTLERKPKE